MSAVGNDDKLFQSFRTEKSLFQIAVCDNECLCTHASVKSMRVNDGEQLYMRAQLSFSLKVMFLGL